MIDPSDQVAPPDYCHPEDHYAPGASAPLHETPKVATKAWEVGWIPPGWTKGETLEIWASSPKHTGRIQRQGKTVSAAHPQAYDFYDYESATMQAWLDWWSDAPAEKLTPAQEALILAEQHMEIVKGQIARLQPGDQAQIAGLAQQMLDLMELAGGHAPLLLSYVSCSFAKLYATVLAHGVKDTHDPKFIRDVRAGKVEGMSMQGDVLTLDSETIVQSSEIIEPAAKPGLLLPPGFKKELH